MNALLLPIVGSAVRWLLTLAGAAGVAATDDLVTQVASAAVSLGSLVWSVYQKVKAEKKAKKAV